MDLIVQRIGDGWGASYGGKTWRAAVGHNGIGRDKAEGDGVSPAGCWPIRTVLYRADKLGAPPRSVFTTAAIDPRTAGATRRDIRLTIARCGCRLPLVASSE